MNSSDEWIGKIGPIKTARDWCFECGEILFDPCPVGEISAILPVTEKNRVGVHIRTVRSVLRF
ncbi:hypothetical protein MKL11_20705 [Methylobacterium sp. J-077]|nr:hypothetical protein [Methylobacterium sp. J-077]